MQLLNKLKELIISARKSGNTLEKDILSVILGEAQTLEARQGKISEDQVYNLIRKQIESNKEILKLDIDPTFRLRNIQENEILERFLPQTLSIEELKERVQNLELSGKSEGQAIGIIMKYCKANGLNVLGETVKELVKSNI